MAITENSLPSLWVLLARVQIVIEKSIVSWGSEDRNRSAAQYMLNSILAIYVAFPTVVLLFMFVGPNLILSNSNWFLVGLVVFGVLCVSVISNRIEHACDGNDGARHWYASLEPDSRRRASLLTHLFIWGSVPFIGFLVYVLAT